MWWSLKHAPSLHTCTLQVRQPKHVAEDIDVHDGDVHKSTEKVLPPLPSWMPNCNGATVAGPADVHHPSTHCASGQHEALPARSAGLCVALLSRHPCHRRLWQWDRRHACHAISRCSHWSTLLTLRMYRSPSAFGNSLRLARVIPQRYTCCCRSRASAGGTEVK